MLASVTNCLYNETFSANFDNLSDKSLIIRLVVSGLMIIVGTIIYLAFRQNILFFDWCPPSLIELFNGSNLDTKHFPGYFIAYCLPDGLWYAALLIFQYGFHEHSVFSRLIYVFSICLPFILELLQLYNYVSGTFDPMDLYTYAFVLILFTCKDLGKMLNKFRCIFIQVSGLILFCVMAAASSSSQHAASDSGIDWRGAAVGGVAGYNGYLTIGRASSEAEARKIAASKGYSEYLWDSVNGVVYAK